MTIRAPDAQAERSGERPPINGVDHGSSGQPILSAGRYWRHSCRDENAHVPRFREPRRTCSELGDIDFRHERENRRNAGSSFAPLRRR